MRSPAKLASRLRRVAGSAFCVLWLVSARANAQSVEAPAPGGPLGFPVPLYPVELPRRTLDLAPAGQLSTSASLGMPQTAKPSVAPQAPPPAAKPVRSPAPAAPPLRSPQKAPAATVEPEVLLPQPVAAQEKLAQPQKEIDLDDIQLTPPSADQLFRPESEATSRERIRKAAVERKVKTIDFPKDLPLPTVDKVERVVSDMFVAEYAPSVICYHPLYFEQRLPERYGFFLPLAQPILSAGKFYADVLALPVRMTVHRPWQWQCSYVSLCQ